MMAPRTKAAFSLAAGELAFLASRWARAGRAEGAEATSTRLSSHTAPQRERGGGKDIVSWGERERERGRGGVRSGSGQLRQGGRG